MDDFKRRFVVDTLLQLLEYTQPINTTIEDVTGEYIIRGHIKVDGPVVRIIHVGTGFEVAYIEKSNIQTITYDVEFDYATIQLSIRR